MPSIFKGVDVINNTRQQNHQEGYAMAQNGWLVRDIIFFCKRLNMPATVAKQFIQGHKSYINESLFKSA